MKYALACVILFVISGCATPREPMTIPASTEIRGYDFREYDEFLFTPGDYSGEYDAIGIVTFSVWPRAEYKDSLYFHDSGFNERRMMWAVGQVNTDNAIRTAHDRAVEMGADALTHFNIGTISRQLPNGGSMDGIEVSGYAIDRK